MSKVFLTDEVETHALSGIHLDLREGEYLSIAGPSGLRQVHAALHPRPAGHAERRALRAQRQAGARAEAGERARIRNREIGFIFQAFNLIGDLTVYENVELPLTYRGMSSAERKRRAQEALERWACRTG